MEVKTSFIEPLFERAEEYGKTSYELFKLKAVDKTATVVSVLVLRSIIIFTLSVFVVIASIGAALWIGDLLGKSYYGFFCIAGFYGILGGVIYFFLGNTIKKSVENSVISQLLN